MGRLLIIALMLVGVTGFSQEEFKKDMYRGNYHYDKKEYKDALHYFDKIIDQSPLNFKANFNKGNTHFRMKEYEVAGDIFESIADLAPSRFDRSKVYHNLGNALLMNKDVDGAIEAYKNGLRLNPGDEETRYNLAFAQQLKKQQEEQQQQQQQQQQGDQGEEGDQGDSQDQQEGQEGQEGENGDQNQNDGQDGQEGDNQDGRQEETEEGEDRRDGDGDKGDRKEEGEGQESDGSQNGQKKDGQGTTGGERMTISKEQARRILETAYKREKGVKQRLLERKLIANGKSNKKDW